MRCLRNVLERQSFPVLGFCDRATTAPCGGEGGSQTKDLQLGGSKEGGWVYTGLKLGAKMETPVKMVPEVSTVSEPVKTAGIVNPTENEIAAFAYQLWLERGCPIGSDQEDWFRAEAMLKNALVVKCGDLFRRPSIPRCDTRTESEMLAEFTWERWEGHWEVWEREWVGARWVWEERGSGVGASNRARPSGKAA